MANRLQWQKMVCKGISLLEVMLSLSIIAAILLMATRYYQVTQFSANINASVNLIKTVQAAAGRYRSIEGSYTGMTPGALNTSNVLVQRGYIPCQPPTGQNTCTVLNPFGGAVTIGLINTDQNVTVALGSLSEKACKNLEGKFPLPANLASPPTQCAGSGSSYIFTTAF